MARVMKKVVCILKYSLIFSFLSRDIKQGIRNSLLELRKSLGQICKSGNYLFKCAKVDGGTDEASLERRKERERDFLVFKIIITEI